MYLTGKEREWSRTELLVELNSKLPADLVQPMLVHLACLIREQTERGRENDQRDQQERVFQEFRRGVDRLSRTWRIGIREGLEEFEKLSLRMNPMFGEVQNRVRRMEQQELFEVIKTLQETTAKMQA